MEFQIHSLGNNAIAAELVQGSMKLESVSDMMDVMANAGIQGAAIHFLHQSDIPLDFFDLKTGFAGEILQKYSNYRNKLAIVGDYSDIESKSMKDFMFECRKTGQILFAESIAQAINYFER